MKRRGYWTAALAGTIASASAALLLAVGASAGNSGGALNCPLPKYNPNKYALQASPTQQTVTCTIVGASDASGKTTVPVIIKSSDIGNTTVTGFVSGTTITFTFKAPTNGCNTSVVAYISNGNNTNSSLIGGKGAAAGFAFVDGSGNAVTDCNGPPPPPPPAPVVSLGYADNYHTHGNPGGLPWITSPPTYLIGCAANPNGGGSTLPTNNCPQLAPGVDQYDAGAIKVVNGGSAAFTVTNSSVQIGTCTYTPWPGLNITLQPGQSLVLTQTGGPNPCVGAGTVVGNYNFDTSESEPGGGGCIPNDGLIPQVNLTINGNPLTINDTGQILNQAGQDPGDCLVDEFHAFTQVYP